MNKDDDSGMERKRANLTHLLVVLNGQDEIIKDLIPRTAGLQGASESVMRVLRNVFQDAASALPEKRISFDDNNDLDGLLAQISLLRSKVSYALTELRGRIPKTPSPVPEQRPFENGSSNNNQNAPDPRRVFVVHGRNELVRQAMFSFLRAINLEPIEWEKAVAMTGQGAPYTGDTVDAAFLNAQAAVVLITGDDLACLQEEFISEHDDDNERKPMPQARPNVLFELGLAFGRKPNRTIIVEFGKTRPISDAIGRNVIRFSDTTDFRLKLAGRLRNAGCAVDTDSRSEWINSKFDLSAPARVPVHDLRFEQRIVQAETIPNASDHGENKEPNPLLPNGENEFIATSPDGFSIHIKREEGHLVKGLVLYIENHRLDPIGPFQLRILSARSYDSRHEEYRQNDNFRPSVDKTTKPTQPSCTGDGLWLIRKSTDSTHLNAGSGHGSVMEWPNADSSSLQQWLLRIDASTRIVQKTGAQAVPLRTLALDLTMRWNPKNNEFFIDHFAAV